MIVRRNVGLLAVGLAGALALAGCATGRDSASGGGAAPAVDAPAAVPEDGRRAGETGGRDDGGIGGELVDTRAIIFTGTITVRVDDVDAAAERAATVAARYGGFVGGDERTRDHDSARATLVLRIPSERFGEAVSALSDLGDEESRVLRTEDVTEEVADLETRIATAEASVARTRELLDRAESISDIVALEEELSAREDRLARLQARQRMLEDLTTLSTITLVLLTAEAEQPVDAEEPADTGFLAGLRSGWRGFLNAGDLLLTVLGWMLPWLVAIALPVTGIVLWRRRRATGRGPGLPPQPEPGAPLQPQAAPPRRQAAPNPPAPPAPSGEPATRDPV